MSTAGIGGELNVAYDGNLSTYYNTEADATFAQRDRLSHSLQPFVRFSDRLRSNEWLYWQPSAKCDQEPFATKVNGGRSPTPRRSRVVFS